MKTEKKTIPVQEEVYPDEVKEMALCPPAPETETDDPEAPYMACLLYTSPLGFPLRTRKTMVDVYGAESSGSSCSQPASMRPARSRRSMSYDRARVTTSARLPSITDRAWLPEPP